MKKLMLLLMVLTTLSCAAERTPDIAGTWQGTLQTRKDSRSGFWILLRTVLKIAKADDGGWKAVFYYADQGEIPVSVTSVAVEGSVFKFSIDPRNIHYRGKLSANGSSIAGVWMQGNSRRLLNFKRVAAAQTVTGKELEEMLAAAVGKPDTEVARQLSALELTERLGPARLSRCERDLPGPQARQALTVLADRSAFLDPPADEIPALAHPDLAAQDKMIALTVDYVNNTIHHLPNLFATRATSTFNRNLWFDNPLHAVGNNRVTVLYRQGQEKVHSDWLQQGTEGLTTSGEFGPILGTVMLDAAQGNLLWSHWEQGAAGPLAVYRYAVSAKKSHYEVENQLSGYEGEIAIDPANGAILRLVLRADPEPTNPLLTADMVVEYGPVELGGKTYICPLKGVALSQGVQAMWLNDIVFEHYHLFRANMRILPAPKDLH